MKIQALNYEDAVGRIKDEDYYEEDGEIVDSKIEVDNHLEIDNISDWEDVVYNPFIKDEQLWTSEY